MSPRTPYDVDAAWDDPFERANDRRAATRCRAAFLIKIAAHVPESKTPLVGPGRIEDLSIYGLRCVTKHRLTQGEVVQVAIPTKEFPEASNMPRSFVGSARVIRIAMQDDAHSVVSLQFDAEFASDMNFTLFWDYLNALSAVNTG